MFKRMLHTYTEEDGITFELKGDITEDKCVASVKGTINGVVTVDGVFDKGGNDLEVELNQFFTDALSAHNKALKEAFPDEVAA